LKTSWLFYFREPCPVMVGKLHVKFGCIHWKQTLLVYAISQRSLTVCCRNCSRCPGKESRDTSEDSGLGTRAATVYVPDVLVVIVVVPATTVIVLRSCRLLPAVFFCPLSLSLLFPLRNVMTVLVACSRCLLRLCFFLLLHPLVFGSSVLEPHFNLRTKTHPFSVTLVIPWSTALVRKVKGAPVFMKLSDFQNILIPFKFK
jgi:hypothetical protein